MQSFSEITCPHCFEPLTIQTNIVEGEEQEFIIDCEVCCRPIQIRIHFEHGGPPLIQADPE